MSQKTNVNNDTTTSYWYGMVRNGRRTYALNYEWVLLCFKRGFLNQCLQEEGKWHQVHPGAAATKEQIENSPNAKFGAYYGYDNKLDSFKPGYTVDQAKQWVDQPKWTPPTIEHNPVIAFPQGRASTCLYASIASAFAYFGDLTTATIIYNLRLTSNLQSRTSELRDNTYIKLHNTLHKTETRYQMTKCSKFYNASKKQDPNAKYYVHAGQLLGTDNGIHHFVAYCNKWVFDSTLVHAVPNCKESLDWCCSGYGEKKSIKYMGFTGRHYVFVPFEQKPFMRLPNCQRFYNKPAWLEKK